MTKQSCTPPKETCETPGCTGCCFPQQNTNGKCSDGSTPFTGTTSGPRVSTGALPGGYAHTHTWTIGENGNGVTGPGGGNSHTHQISNFQFSEEMTTSTSSGHKGYEPNPPDLAHTHDDIPRATTEVSPTQENTDIYGGYPDVDLYNQVPTTYGTLYLLKDFGGNLQASSFDIDWMSTDLYSTATVKAPLESEGSTSGGSSPSPSAVPSAFASLEGVGAFRGAEVATSEVLDNYLMDPWSMEEHPGLIIGATLVYTPGAQNTTWEDEGMDEVGAIYGIISLRAGSNNSAYVEWAEPINWGAYNNTSGNPWSVYVTHGSETDSLEGSYLLYDTTLELPYLSYKFGYGDPASTQNDYSAGTYSAAAAMQGDYYVRHLAAQIVADEIPNQIINNVIDYGTIKKSQLSTFETTEALQRGIEPTTYTPDPGPS